MLADLDLYLFDTQGFVMLRGVAADLVTQLKAEVEPHLRPDADQDNTVSCRDIVVRSAVVRELAGSPRVTGMVRPVVNQPFRLIEAYAVGRFAESRLPLHNGLAEPIRSLQGEPALNLSHSHGYRDGRLYCMFVKALIYLDPIGSEDDGPFCFVPGSHKANLPILPLLAGDTHPHHTIADGRSPLLDLVYVEPGDVLLLNESLTHGTYPKHSTVPRTVLALSYAPSFVGDWRPYRSSDPIVGGEPGHYEAYEGDVW